PGIGRSHGISALLRHCRPLMPEQGWIRDGAFFPVRLREDAVDLPFQGDGNISRRTYIARDVIGYRAVVALVQVDIMREFHRTSPGRIVGPHAELCNKHHRLFFCLSRNKEVLRCRAGIDILPGPLVMYIPVSIMIGTAQKHPPVLGSVRPDYHRDPEAPEPACYRRCLLGHRAPRHANRTDTVVDIIRDLGIVPAQVAPGKDACDLYGRPGDMGVCDAGTDIYDPSRGKTSRELFVRSPALLVPVHPDRHRGAARGADNVPALGKLHAHLCNLFSPVCKIGAAYKPDYARDLPKNNGTPNITDLDILDRAPPGTDHKFLIFYLLCCRSHNQRMHRNLLCAGL